MSHPRVEEVEDSDVDMSDPSEGDIDDFSDADIMRRVSPAAAAAPSSSSSSRPTASVPPAGARTALLNPAAVPSLAHAPNQAAGDFNAASNPAVYAGYQCLYPVYFDAGRSRAEGRRVPASLAVRNPLAGDIANACARLRLQTVLEPTKLHPKDWANPGRVRVHLAEKEGGAKNVNNKHHLYLLVAQHLRENPAADHCASLRLHVPGLPMPDASKPYPRPAVPRGWKMGELLPYYSPAMTGGGVSENLFKDMMKEMQGPGGPGGPGADMAGLLAAAAGAGAGGSGGAGGGGEEKKKKDKKGKGKS